MRPAIPFFLFWLGCTMPGVALAEPEFAGRNLSAWVKDLGDKNPLVREEALEAIARLGAEAKPAADAVRPLLKDPVTTARLRAAIALAKIEQTAGSLGPVLAEAARDPTRSIRLLVLEAAQEIGIEPRETAAVLVECLNDADLPLRERARAWLERLGAPALPALSAALKHKSPDTVQQSLRLIGSLGPRAADAAPAVRERLKDESALTRIAAAQALWLVSKDSEASVPVLAALARDPSFGTRAQAFAALMQIKPMPPVAVPAFEAALADADLLTRTRAATALWELDGRTKTTLPVLLAAFKQSNNYTAHHEARLALSNMKAHAKAIVPAVIEAVQAVPGYSNLYSGGIALLGRMGDEAVAPLAALLKERDPSLRQFALAALIAAGDKGAVLAANLLPKADHQDKLLICRQLSRYQGNAEAVMLGLAEMLKDPDQNLAEAAVSSLTQQGLRAAPAAAAIAAHFKEAKANQFLRYRIAHLFGSIGPAGKGAVPTLVEMTKDTKSEDYIREQAAHALSSIGPEAHAALKDLTGMLKDAKVPLRLALLGAVIQIDPAHEAVVPELLKLIEDPAVRTSGARGGALNLLGGLGADAKLAVPALIKAIKGGGQIQERREMIALLTRIGPAAREAIPALKELLDSKEPVVQADAGCALLSIGDTSKEAVAALLSGVRNRNVYNRQSALDALARLGPGNAGHAEDVLAIWRAEGIVTDRLRLAEIISLLDPKASRELMPWLRQQMVSPYNAFRAAVVLWRIDPRSPDGLPYLIRLARDTNFYYRALAMQGFGLIGSGAREALPELETALDAKRDPRLPLELRPQQDEQLASLRVSAARAIWRVDAKKTDKAAEVLLEALRNDAPGAAYYRSQAAEGLGLLGPGAAVTLPALAELYRTQPPALRRVILDAIRKIDPKGAAKLIRP